MIELTQENMIVDFPGLHRFRIGDKVVADECASHDRHEGVVVGIEMQRMYGSSYLVPSITLLHDGYLRDGFKPDDLRHIDPAPAPQVATDPESAGDHARIWLEPPGAPDRSWCSENVYGEGAVEYVREDLSGSPRPAPAPNKLTRPIIGIENRTAQEVFDIMSDRICTALAPAPAPQLVGQFLPTEDGEFNGNEQPEVDLSTLEEIKYLTCTAGAPDHMPVPKALARILFLCNRACVTKKLDELRPLFETTENHS